MTRIDGLCKRGHDTRLPDVGYAFIKNGIAYIMCKLCNSVRQQIRRTTMSDQELDKRPAVANSALEAFTKLCDLLASIDTGQEGDFIENYGLAKPLNQLEAALTVAPDHEECDHPLEWHNDNGCKLCSCTVTGPPVATGDPLLDGKQHCATCGVAGSITFDPADGYGCSNCGSNDSMAATPAAEPVCGYYEGVTEEQFKASRQGMVTKPVGLENWKGRSDGSEPASPAAEPKVNIDDWRAGSPMKLPATEAVQCCPHAEKYHSAATKGFSVMKLTACSMCELAAVHRFQPAPPAESKPVCECSHPKSKHWDENAHEGCDGERFGLCTCIHFEIAEFQPAESGADHADHA